MVISKIMLKDFKSYKDTVEIKFGGRFNVIIGKIISENQQYLKHFFYGKNAITKV